MNEKIENLVNRLFIILLVALVIFFSFLEPIQKHTFIHFLQKNCMLASSAALFLNIRYRFTSTHYALSMLFALTGLLFSFSHATYHICPEAIPYGDPFFRLSMYSWWSVSFLGELVFLSILLCFHKPHKTPCKKSDFAYLALMTISALFILVQHV
jgi:hypothetical protein